jgi:hypothetical protein
MAAADPAQTPTRSPSIRRCEADTRAAPRRSSRPETTPSPPAQTGTRARAHASAKITDQVTRVWQSIHLVAQFKAPSRFATRGSVQRDR